MSVHTETMPVLRGAILFVGRFQGNLASSCIFSSTALTAIDKGNLCPYIPDPCPYVVQRLQGKLALFS